MANWGTAVGTIFSFFSPEQTKVRIRNKIEKLERKRNAILEKKASAKQAADLFRVNAELHKYHGVLKNAS